MSKDEYLITDAPLKALTVFAMPMILGSFFQQVYNMADSIIVGQFVGSTPNNCSAVYQKELALLLIQASPHPLLIAFRN